MDIENLQHSIFDGDVKFTASYMTPHEVYRDRKENFDSTDMYWITLKPVCTEFEIHNPKALILLHLN